MATWRRRKSKPWAARVRNGNGGDFFIGYFENQDEAECAEYDHGRKLPSEGGLRRGRRKAGSCHCD